jgi:anti-sigma B factor antagonist
VSHPGLSVHARPDGRRHTVVLAGELDLATAPELEQMSEQLCANGARELVLDLQGLEFIDSTGLSAILRVSERCEAYRCTLYLTPGPPKVQRLFELTGLLERLPFVELPALGDAPGSPAREAS